MISRGEVQWLLLGLIALMAVVAADYGVFVYRQRQGDVLSYVTVREYLPVPGSGGNYSYQYAGVTDISCVEAMLPHERMSPCWWVELHHGHWQ